MQLLRSWAASAILASLLGGSAAAQTPGSPKSGTVELGAFGQWTSFDENAGRLNAVPEDGFGYGGRLGFFLTPRLQLEGDGYYSPQDRDLNESFCCSGAQPRGVNASAFALRLNYNLPIAGLLGAPSQLLLGAGAVRTNYAMVGGAEAEDDVSSFGGSALAGLRLGLARGLALRLDGVLDYMPNHDPSANLNMHARAGLSLLMGTARPFVAMAPPPPPPPVEVLPPVAAPIEETIRVCVVQGTQVTEIDAIRSLTRGDTMVMVGGERRSFASVHPASAPGYAAGSGWYINNEAITVANRRYVRYGLPQVIAGNRLSHAGDFGGVVVFTETGSATPHAVLYMPLRPGCEFQAYQLQTAVGGVRG